MTDAIPGLFDRVPRSLFGPLGDSYAEIYWEILARLYRSEFEREPFFVLRAVAVDTAEQTIRDSVLWATRRAELEALACEPDNSESSDVPARSRFEKQEAEVSDDAAVVRALARRLIARLERCGWIHFQYRAGQGEIMSFYPYAARILDALIRVARDEQPVFQGYVHSIAALLDPRAFAQRPGVSLAEARRHTLELLRELKILERNIHFLTQRLLDEADTAASVLAEGLDRYEHAVMANYHRLKTIDNVYRQRSAILDRLTAIERDAQALEAAAEWYAAQERRTSREARQSVDGDLHLLRAHFDAIPDLVDEIDARNSRFSGVALRKIRYLLRQDRRIEGQLEYIVGAIAQGDVPELEFDVYRCELLADGFLYTSPARRPRPGPQVLHEPAQIDREAVYRDAAARVRRLSARRRVEEYAEALLAGRSSVSLDEADIEGDDDYVRMLYLVAYGLEGESSFRFQADSARLQKGPYGCPSGRLARQSRNRRPARVRQEDNEWISSKTTQG